MGDDCHTRSWRLCSVRQPRHTCTLMSAAAARARERAFAAARKEEEGDDKDEDEDEEVYASTYASTELHDDGDRAHHPRILRVVKSSKFTSFIFLAEMVAAILVGLQTSPVFRQNVVIIAIETWILLIFILEAVLKILSERRQSAPCYDAFRIYFADGWNVLDFSIVVAGSSNYVLKKIDGVDLDGAGNAILVFRLLRLLRIFRVLKSAPQLRIVVKTMILALSSLKWVSILIFLLLYVYAVMGVFIFGDNDEKHFGNLGISLISLFRVATFDRWSTMWYVQLYGCSQAYSPEDTAHFGCQADSHDTAMAAQSVVFFFTFIMLISYVVLNLFVAVAITSIAKVSREDKANNPPIKTDEISHEVSNQDISLLVVALKAEIQDCRNEIRQWEGQIEAKTADLPASFDSFNIDATQQH